MKTSENHDKTSEYFDCYANLEVISLSKHRVCSVSNNC